MNQINQVKTANILRNIARYTMLTIGILLFVFALLSGSEEYGGGLMGIIKNSPNAAPWLGLLVFVFIAWKWELPGGILIVSLGLFVTWFMSIRGNNFYIIPFIFFLLIITMGVFFLVSWYLRKNIEL
ncbi:MAG: hypothetical protein QNK30_03165 [Bacteroidales bacterium]|nr:hypothetical protein [Bacteroidales bacterium]